MAAMKLFVLIRLNVTNLDWRIFSFSFQNLDPHSEAHKPKPYIE